MAERKALALIGGKVSEIPAGDTIRGAGGSIPQLSSDPISPVDESAWVRASPVLTVGSPLGLLLAITQASSTFSYELRYRTLNGVTVGVPLT
jgi:hypothetical protein